MNNGSSLDLLPLSNGGHGWVACIGTTTNGFFFVRSFFLNGCNGNDRLDNIIFSLVFRLFGDVSSSSVLKRRGGLETVVT